MKTALKDSLKLACLAAALCAACAAAARAQQPAAGLTPERVRMDQLDLLSTRAEKFVDVSVDENLLRLPVTLFANSKDPKSKEVAEIISGLKGVYVRVFEFAAAGQYSESDFSGIREQVRGAGWSRLVNVVNKRDDRHVEVFLQTGPGSVGGLVVIATEPKSLAVVNIIGKIDVERLSKLEGKFGIPELADLMSGGVDDDDDKPKPATKKP